MVAGKVVKSASTENPKNRPNPKEPNEIYVVWAKTITDQGSQTDIEFDSFHCNKASANKRVEGCFFSDNPWDLSEQEMLQPEIGDELKRKMANGLLSMSVNPPDSEFWEVGAVAVKEYDEEYFKKMRADADGEDEDDDE
jgi:hypothetical protein